MTFSIRALGSFQTHTGAVSLAIQEPGRYALTRSCYQRDIDRLLAHVRKPLKQIGLADVQSFAQSLIAAGLAPISRALTIAAVRSLFGFCFRMHYFSMNPAAELSLPRYEDRLAARGFVRGGGPAAPFC